MIRNTLVGILLLLSLPAVATSLTFSSGAKSKDEYKFSKCISGTFAVSALTARLTADEICEYGKKGCSGIKAEDKMKVYCEHGTLSACFEKRSWLAIDHILGASLTEEPGLVTYGLKKGSPHEGKTCAFWD